MEDSSKFSALGAILILLFFASGMKACSAAVAVGSDIKASTEFIRNSCRVTRYPRICFQSLCTHASDIQTSPKKLAIAALSVSLTSAQSTSAMLLNVSTTHQLKPREAAAMSDCVKTIGDSIDEIQQSLREMKRLDDPEFQNKISNINTWVSAALTDDDTCMDGFSRKAMNGEIKTKVRSRIVKVAQLTSNALALIVNLPSTHA